MYKDMSKRVDGGNSIHVHISRHLENDCYVDICISSRNGKYINNNYNCQYNGDVSRGLLIEAEGHIYVYPSQRSILDREGIGSGISLTNMLATSLLA